MTSGRPGATPQDWLLRLLPLALLIILGLAGLRGSVPTTRWDGPLHRDGLVIGLALEVVLGTLLVITIRRRSANLDAQQADPASVVLPYVARHPGTPDNRRDPLSGYTRGAQNTQVFLGPWGLRRAWSGGKMGLYAD